MAKKKTPKTLQEQVLPQKRQDEPALIDMEAVLRRYPPPGSSKQDHGKKITEPAKNQKPNQRETPQKKQTADISNFDMNAALDMYSPHPSPRPGFGKSTCSPPKSRPVGKKPAAASSKCDTGSNSDEFSFDYQAILKNYLPSAEDLCQKDIDDCAQDSHQGELRRQLRQGLKRCKIDDQIDLHGQYQKEARENLQNFLYHAQTQRLQKVLIVHGKGHHSCGGKGVLQSLVWEFLQEAKAAGRIQDFHHPIEREGGKGGTVVLLRHLRKRGI